jgi:hypothetical protein
MLIFVLCNVDIATQDILERAKDLDPEGIVLCVPPAVLRLW